MHKTSDGQTVLIVPGPDFKLSPNSTRGFLRKFVFTEVAGIITAGRIVEIFGPADYMAANKATLFENYIAGKMIGFTGTVVSYDATYHYMVSEVFQNGNKTGDAKAWLQKGRFTNANSNRTPIIASTGGCIDWYLVTNYSNGTSSEEYLFTTCLSREVLTIPKQAAVEVRVTLVSLPLIVLLTNLQPHPPRHL